LLLNDQGQYPRSENPAVRLVGGSETGHETVIICRGGKPVAELRALTTGRIDPLIEHPELAGRILYDPTEPAEENEWPEAAR